ncbi:hypothetical protein FRC02_000566 [Tulasnella sp. 418]|nr:hypothetical protein FRC02_000566 [Tulasnella sp. 418]
MDGSEKDSVLEDGYQSPNHGASRSVEPPPSPPPSPASVYQDFILETLGGLAILHQDRAVTSTNPSSSGTSPSGREDDRDEAPSNMDYYSTISPLDLSGKIEQGKQVAWGSNSDIWQGTLTLDQGQKVDVSQTQLSEDDLIYGEYRQGCHQNPPSAAIN